MGRSEYRSGTLLIAAVACACSLFFAVQIWSFDAWWHLAAGRYVVETGSLPLVDEFSFSALGQKWHGAPWLSELIFYGAFALLGPSGAVLVQTLSGALILLFSGLSLRESGLRSGAAAALLPFIAVLLQIRYGRVRPETIAAVLLALLLFLALRSLKNAKKPPYYIVLILVPWVAVHTSVVVGLGLAGLAAIEAGRREGLKVFFKWLVPAFLTGLCLLLTEVGRGVLYQLWVHTQSVQAGAVYHFAEWRAASLSDRELWLPLFLFLLSFAWGLKREGRSVFALSLSLTGFLLALKSQRFVAPAVIMQMPLWGSALGSALLRARGRPLLLGLLPLSLSSALVLVHLAISPALANRSNLGFSVAEGLFPRKNAERLLSLPEGRVFNQLSFGGYLIWKRVPVLFDGRAYQLYTPEQIEELMIAPSRSIEALNQLADEYDLHYGLTSVRTEVGAYMMMSPDWLPLAHDEASTLFVRRKYARRVAEIGVPIFASMRHLPIKEWTRSWYSQVLSSEQGQADLSRALCFHHKEAPTAPIYLAILASLEEDFPGARPRLMSRCR